MMKLIAFFQLCSPYRLMRLGTLCWQLWFPLSLLALLSTYADFWALAPTGPVPIFLSS
jgi:hypothetical protein